MEINRDMAAKVLEIVDAGLIHGGGTKPIAGQICVEQAVCMGLGLPHSDNPSCVSPALRSLKMRLNDSPWSSDQARARGLRRLALAQLGSRDHLDEKEFVRRAVDHALRKSCPEALRAAASVCKDKTRTAALIAAAARCESEGTRDAATDARAIARTAAYYAAADADAAYAAAADAQERGLVGQNVVRALRARRRRGQAAADYAADYAAVTAATAAAAVTAATADAAAAADYAAYATDYAAVTAATAAAAVTAATADAVTAAADYAAADYAADYAAVTAATAAAAVAAATADAVTAAADYAAADYAAARDKSLAAYAETVVQILIDMKAPGCQWLDLAPLERAA